ncbi:UbiD family decarboxylase domain-containing protein [Planctomicrobium sp. SH668]|uniref:UbiD family decarboxylase domain-containing protein n=1 Tax=Planctomicrobium sp. SH668 TaxID=3448126 RepID=UPI003F5AF3B7
MAFDDLTKFLQVAADAGELERIPVAIETDQEIAALTQQICREFRNACPVILIENPSGSQIPVVTNLLGSPSRFLATLGATHFDEVIERLKAALDPIPSHRDWKSTFAAAVNSDRAKYSARTIRRGMAQQVIKVGADIDLREYPTLRCWSRETNPSITAAVIITESIEGVPSVERLPVEVVGPQTLQIHWHSNSKTYANWLDRQTTRAALPIALALGGDPLLSYIASLPLPNWLDAWYVMGVFRNDGLNLMRARSLEMNVPADAEIIFEGEIEPGELLGTGLLASEAGIYEERTNLPRMSLTAITHRANPIFPARVCSIDTSEDLVTNSLTEKLILAVLKITGNSVHDLHLPDSGFATGMIVFSTRATDVQKIFRAISGLPLATTSRPLVAVGENIDVRNVDAVVKEISLSLLLNDRAPQRHLAHLTSPNWIDATNASDSSTLSLQCRPTSQILDQLARQFRSAE